MPISILNQELVNQKIDTIKSNLDKTHIVADFDGTLTQYFDHEKNSRPSLISVLRSEGILGEEYTRKANELMNIYHPMEYDHHLSWETRKEKMQERRSKHHALLLET